MKSKIVIATLLLAVAACGGPRIPDPRFELPPAPQELNQKPAELKKIETPQN